MTRDGLILLLPAFLSFASLAFANGTTNGAELTPTSLESTQATDTVRSFLQLQQQIHATQLSIERNRQEAETAASRNAEVLAVRLKALEDALSTQRAQELEAIEAIQNANRLMVKVGGACAAVGFLALMLTAYFQWRAVSRLTEFSVLSQASLAMGRGPVAALGAADASVATIATEQVNTRLLGALERLEKRILELEHTAQPPLGDRLAGTASSENGNAPDRVALLLAKGESLLSLDKTEEALACYDEILALEPDHTDALVKKGDALERLRKIDDAIGCYDRAIAAGRSLTVAYLHKGGLFNRLERYEEALQCYEQALRTQEKSHSA